MYFPRNRVFWSVALGHMTNDVFMSMGPVLLAFIGGVYFEIPPAYIGIALSAREMLGAISQPLFGWMSDKGSSRILGAGGVTVTVLMLSLSMFLAMVGNFWLMIIPFALSALGSGAFHPVGTSFASHGNEARAASNTAYFFLFGQMGLALGPVLIGYMLELTQTNGAGGSVFPVFFVALASIPAILFMSATIPVFGQTFTSTAEGEEKPKQASAENVSKPLQAGAIRSLLILAVVVLLRGMASPGSVAFIPALFEFRGWSPSAYGWAASLYWVGSAFAGVWLGSLADRYGRRRMVIASLALAAPAFFLLPIVDGALAFLMVFLAGALAGGAHSIFIVLAQSLLPGRKGFASGVALGYTFGAGSVATLALGYISDGAFGIEGMGLIRAFQLIGVFVLASAFLAFLLPASVPRKRKPSITESQLEPEGAD